MSKVINEENECDQIADAVTVERQIERALREVIVVAFKYLKIVEVPWPTEANAEENLASGYVEIRVLVELCQRILDLYTI